MGTEILNLSVNNPLVFQRPPHDQRIAVPLPAPLEAYPLGHPENIM